MASSFTRNPKDFWSGVIFIGIGLAAILIGRDYSLGTTGRMGPGYFPTILGALLAVLGSVSVLRSLLRPGESLERFAVKSLLLVLIGVLGFGLLMRGAGVVPAIVGLVLIGACASVKFKLLPSLLLAAGLAIFSALVFVKGLGLPMPILGTWFGS
ncbi:tripartite tricarboxylate transporter TctB family protein [Herbaspirillum sp. GCM10030257]|uniref:tripartite tricarboxylate transporter TctB family protein n=1 Tax=Herbaspirillum sp. GCM10030257 TaxID=3273393 RepID=UPI00360CEA72